LTGRRTGRTVGGMDLSLRRHLYEQAARTRGRQRRALRRQIALLTAAPGRPDGGAAGVREPRRPRPSTGPTAARR
jgi:hypothetical protein